MRREAREPGVRCKSCLGSGMIRRGPKVLRCCDCPIGRRRAAQIAAEEDEFRKHEARKTGPINPVAADLAEKLGGGP